MRDEPLRDDHRHLEDRRALTEDAARPDAVARRHAGGGRTARENVDDLVDPGSFVEYGRFAIAAQRHRRDVSDLIAHTPADGLIAGTARINGHVFGDERSACAVLSYDYTVLAGTQGALGHRKKDRLFELIQRMELPTVFFAEGGGGRPGDTDYPVVSALDTRAFALWASLSGLIPRIAIVKGRCFAGNAVIAGCSDLIVATKDSSIGMGGPAMIAGGGLGDVHPDEVGPISTQAPNGVVDVVVDDEAHAVAVTKTLLGYFQGATPPGAAADQTLLRTLVPERERRAYPVHPIIETLCDTGTVTFLRERFAPEMATALGRIGGRPVGVIANHTRVMAGAITAGAADKAARFLQLCEAFGLPVLSLVDCPGYMVGPAAEADALVRRGSRCPSSWSCCAAATGSARRPWPAAACTSRCSPWRGPARTLDRWGSKAPCGSACARSWRPSSTTMLARTPCAKRRRPPRRTRKHSMPQRFSRSTTSSTPRRREH
jgi:acetyl-CoA carboxylase carboxyltransferase component